MEALAIPDGIAYMWKDVVPQNRLIIGNMELEMTNNSWLIYTINNEGNDTDNEISNEANPLVLPIAQNDSGIDTQNRIEIINKYIKTLSQFNHNL